MNEKPFSAELAAQEENVKAEVSRVRIRVQRILEQLGLAADGWSLAMQYSHASQDQTKTPPQFYMCAQLDVATYTIVSGQATVSREYLAAVAKRLQGSAMFEGRLLSVQVVATPQMRFENQKPSTIYSAEMYLQQQFCPEA